MVFVGSTLTHFSRLGRGTRSVDQCRSFRWRTEPSSTYDGVAIAYATLAHVARSGANTLFVTHYPMVAEELAKEVS